MYVYLELSYCYCSKVYESPVTQYTQGQKGKQAL